MLVPRHTIVLYSWPIPIPSLFANDIPHLSISSRLCAVALYLALGVFMTSPPLSSCPFGLTISLLWVKELLAVCSWTRFLFIIGLAIGIPCTLDSTAPACHDIPAAELWQDNPEHLLSGFDNAIGRWRKGWSLVTDRWKRDPSSPFGGFFHHDRHGRWCWWATPFPCTYCFCSPQADPRLVFHEMESQTLTFISSFTVTLV